MAANEADEEATVSLVDVLEEDEELEQEASAVLGGSDSEKCSYPEGYVKRQALYACNTCTPKGGEPAGICLACSYKCHEGHELFELYTKRNFRCDCGNDKFGEMECKLFPEKEKANSGNKYSHNFFGLYCTCDRPYPDPEDELPDEMIQCIICEDWFHGRHLGCVVPESVELQEMICESCMNKSPFLWTYAAHVAVPPVLKVCKAEEEGKVEVEHDEEETKPEKEVSESTEDNKQQVEVNGTAGCKRKLQELEDTSAEGSCSGCRLEEMKASGQSRAQQGAVFWPSAWRTKLCSCTHCKNLFADAGVAFLLDETDTVLAYENKGKTTEQAGGVEGRDPLMSALNNLNRVQQLEIIHEYNDMKTELKDYLQTFAAEGKVVTPEDIRHFFEQQQTRKRRRANAGQYYCS
ncbi:putative E3 ubiquitin-protein ligase UBR7 isoform X1 [Colossoma macropomum]|uniref:putative E3 ubiquitin-protein ligase UBR7 isoform X1 n=1 Tax=Colossoma macropomum TaxID=42526 RepID=UPI0018644905|nr:putative E3 ubiquitin-protein ligase UBR7 isoform X1 [Colossoma macropomum]